MHLYICTVKLSNTAKHREHFLKKRIQWNLLARSSQLLAAIVPPCLKTHWHTHTAIRQGIGQQRNTRNKSTNKGNKRNLHMLNTGSFSLCHNTHTHTTLGPPTNLLLGASTKWAINSAIATVVRLCKVWMWMLQARVRKLLCCVWERVESGSERARRIYDKAFVSNERKMW